MVAAVPVALGDRPRDGIGNSLSVMLVRLPVHLADPLERLQCAREASLEAMSHAELLGDQLGEWADLVRRRCSRAPRTPTRAWASRSTTARS